MITNQIKTAAAETAFHIHIRGKVQGVGFRPFVFRLARKFGLKGWVNNGMDGVHINVEGEEAIVQSFYDELLTGYPPIARVTHSRIQQSEIKNYADFCVIESSETGTPNVLILPDLDLCDACLSELNDPRNRRYQYPFITCTDCGPRYSIITELPYDRPHTTMRPFVQCPECQREFDDPSNRRFYSQTNSCPACGVRLTLFDADQNVIARENDAIEQTVQLISAGKIVAVKGIGGYLLMADAFNETAVSELRRRKHRPTKPFALMFPSLKTAQGYAQINEAEATLLSSRERPIVILRRTGPGSQIASSVAPNHDTLGVMLPYTPLHHLLLQALQQPVVATSANISGSPILAAEKQVFDLLHGVVDAMLANNREIAVPQDDSVMRIAPRSGATIMLRRSRSHAPLFPHHIVQLKDRPAILALGAQQKSTVTLTHQGNIYISQYLGNLSNYETEQNFHRLIAHFRSLLSFTPEILVADAHPQYAATLAGEKIAEEMQIPLLHVQHHRAHFWALLAERQLLHAKDTVLGVIWDGTGWGDDQTIWGGEFFQYQTGEMTRIAHLNPFPQMFGDKAALEPRLSALALWENAEKAVPLLKNKFTATEWKIYRKYLMQEKFIFTSSMGRLFDGVASLLGLADKISYEGEAAIQLEKIARRHAVQLWSKNILTKHPAYPLPLLPGGKIDLNPMLTNILTDFQTGVSKAKIAFTFHLTLVNLVERIAEAAGVSKIGFSGGVFQNTLLVDLLHQLLADKFQLYFHRHLSPNDENISFGQMIFAARLNGWLA